MTKLFFRELFVLSDNKTVSALELFCLALLLRLASKSAISVRCAVEKRKLFLNLTAKMVRPPRNPENVHQQTHFHDSGNDINTKKARTRTPNRQETMEEEEEEKCPKNT